MPHLILSHQRGRVLLLCAAASCLFATDDCFAKPQHKAAAATYYGDHLPQKLRSCELCHLSDKEIEATPVEQLGDEAQPWNAFGRALAKLGRDQVAAGASQPESIIERLRALADADADEDGIANELEIVAGSKPGEAAVRSTDEELAAAKPRLEKFRRLQPTYAWRPTSRIVRPDVPTTGDAKWIKNPIDALISAEHVRQNISPRPEASKEVLLRRVYIDLIGLPPTREQLAEFLADDSTDAYEKIVNRLLNSPQYGERWGRHWMDVWRYSDWAGWGDQVRDSHPHIWRWRDWIIESLNADKPYDEMVVEMLAADEAKPGDEQAARATGFLVRHFKLLSREQWMTETVDHTSRAFLGVTFKCAQCHDHLYDPLTHEEYFQFRAIFEPYQVRIDRVPGELDTKKEGLSRVYDADPNAKTLFYLRGDERTPDKDRVIVPGVPKFLGGEMKTENVSLPYQASFPTLRTLIVDDLVKQAETKVKEQEKNAESELNQAKLSAAQAELAALKARISAEQAKHAENKDPTEVKPLSVEASRLERQSKLAFAELAKLEAQQSLATAEQALKEKEGDDKLKQAVQAAQKKLDDATKARDAAATEAEKESEAYSPLGEKYSKTSSGRRLAFAKWLTSRDNPLAARVAVNHLWARHFGRGLVETVDDFGQNGRRPQHPALLDWLAAEFMEPTSADSSPAKPWSMKHLHRLIVLSNTYRLGSAYDQTSATADPDNHYFWRTSPRRIEAEVVRDAVLHLGGSLDLTFGGRELDHKQLLQIPRRSLYFRSAPEKQAQFMQIFDTAAPSECYRRRDSIIPQQALALSNSELTIKQSRKLARDLHQAAGESDREFISAAFQQVLTREPKPDELAECEAFLTEQVARLTESKEGATANDPAKLDAPATTPAIHARESLVHVLFNHHDFVMLK